jgi:hypothetical protein
VNVADIVEKLRAIASVDLFAEARDPETFVGRPFHFDYSSVKVLLNDKWKNKVGGVPAGAFLLCAYDGEPGVDEMVLVRVIGPTALPSDSEVVASMVEYYKEGIDTAAAVQARIDSFTRYEFMFSALQCRVLGTFYRDAEHRTLFGADVENFFSAHNYSVFKPRGKVLEYIVNFREGQGIPGGQGQFRIGEVRYSSARRYATGPGVPVFVSSFDFVGKRTALFGMTRTGKSNTVKKLVEATVNISGHGVDETGGELKSIGQIIFDINGEYANPNQQDSGTAIYELFAGSTRRYSIIRKPGFEVMKLNFYQAVVEGFGMLQSLLVDHTADYVRAFLAMDLSEPCADDHAAHTRWERLVAAYKACLFAAGFDAGGHRVSFQGNQDVNRIAGGVDPTGGLTPAQAVEWFTAIWNRYDADLYFQQYRSNNGREWADEDLKATLVMLTRARRPGRTADVSGFRILAPHRELHSATAGTAFEQDILGLLRAGQIVIVDLSQGDPSIQRTYSDRICRAIFADAMSEFIANHDPNFIQFYFEEAHNLFPKKDEGDLTGIYNRLAKEGAKLKLGVVYATQEVSSVSANILKNTQNWFISHLNNRDELKEVEKYYDFGDFVESLRMAADRGFIRMKTYSNSFIVPVQIDRFLSERAGE